YITINDTFSSSSYILSIIFLLKSSHVDRSVSADDSELNIKSSVENLKNMIIKKLSVSCVIRSFIFFLISSVTSFSAASLSVSFSITSQSSTLTSVSDSPALTTSVLIIFTFTTSDFVISAFIISSPHFKKILYRLNESCLSRIISLLNSVEII
ncbi:hypothetical protein BDDG_12210, partial [Blastomyces dermatitidis ATCC 18188]